MTADPAKNIGGASTAILDKIAAKAAPTVSVADAGTVEAFIDSWAETFSDHAALLRSATLPLTAPVVAVFVPDTGAFGVQSGWKKAQMLGASASDNFAGMLIAATGEVGACVHAQTFSQTPDIETAIRTASLGSNPTIGLFSDSKLLVWPDGVDGALKPFVRDMGSNVRVIDLVAIQAELDLFYMLAARQSQKWWKDAAKRVVVERAETKVQADLWLFLIAKLSDVARVKVEEIIGNGRADITIYPIDTSGKNQSAVLELKTLRQVTTPEDPTKQPTKITFKNRVKWAESGIQQTVAYREHHKLDAAVLCLYDFCEGDSNAVVDAIMPALLLHSVKPLRYWITASNKEHREDSVPLATKA